ncbi:P27 family phage terminase small subunit [Bradyrhizobium sp. BRP14]|nr:P27 family phage terminase small subunit [Bradyrhizobium sp. BRP14]
MVGKPGRSGGHNRKPDRTKRLEGNRGHRSHRRRKPPLSENGRELEQLPNGVWAEKLTPEEEAFVEFKPPDHFNEVQTLFWQKLALAVPLSHWKVTTEACLQMAATNWARFVEAEQTIAREGMLIRDRDGNIRRHPAVMISRQAQMDFAKMCATMGIDHIAQMRLVGSGTQEIDWFTEAEKCGMPLLT